MLLLACSPSAAHADYPTVELSPEASASATTVNLFDYWLYDDASKQFAVDSPGNGALSNEVALPERLNAGINKFGGNNLTWPVFNGTAGIQHQLLFFPTLQAMAINKPGFTNYRPWADTKYAGTNNYNLSTGNGTPRQGMVKNTLVNGYPSLQKNSSINLAQDESLAYLFNASDTGSGLKGKKAYLNTTGLLNVDGDGYYYYDSHKNFASFNRSTKQFTLYDGPAVYPYSSLSKLGQFFPFNSPSEVFNENSATAKKDITSVNWQMHHYFGLSMSTVFSQPEGGLVVDGKGQPAAMTYEFSGDDDVWIYIDNVLVGDIGGSHAAVGFKIDFKTGAVYVANSAGVLTQNGTIKSKFQAAGADVSDFDGNTFKSGTNHTLKFFYLERGSFDSNLSLKFNLAPEITSEVVKIDQDGQEISSGVVFNLYATDSSYNVPSGASVLATGATDSNGRLAFKDSKGRLINFYDQYNRLGKQYYVLRESTAPDGYRNLYNEIRLKYALDPHDSSRGTLVQDPDYKSSKSAIWTTGSLATPMISATSNSAVTSVKGTPLTYDQLKSGTVFAMVYRRDNRSSSDWNAVIGGSQVDGWKVSKRAVSPNGQDEYSYQKVVDSYNESKETGYSHEFSFNGGVFDLRLDELPGTITDYVQWGDSAAIYDLYDVRYYYSSATGSEIRGSNTVEITQESFTRSVSTRIYVSNIKNRLYVQKIDENGVPVTGAFFGLYEEDQVTVDSNGKVSVKSGQSPRASIITANLSKDKGDKIDLAAGGVFGMMKPSNSTTASTAYSNYTLKSYGSEPHGSRVYYLKEVRSPDSSIYVKNETVIKVIVDNTGVYADAGTMDDGISVVQEPGQLLSALTGFAQGDTDDTLKWITTTPRSLRIDTSRNEITGADYWTGNSNLRLGYFSEGKDASGTAVKGVLKLQNSFADLNSRTHLEYRSDEAISDYGSSSYSSDAGTAFVADEGWLGLKITQDQRPNGSSSIPRRTDLGANTGITSDDIELAGLMTGETIVRVTNNRVPSGDLAVEKIVKLPGDKDVADSSYKDTQFTFSFEFIGPNGGLYDGDSVEYQVYDSYTDENTNEPATGSGTHGWFQPNSGLTVKLKHGQQVRIFNLERGATFTVTESKADGFSTTAMLGSTAGTVNGSGDTAVGGIITTESQTATFTNIRQRGLKIYKEDEDGKALEGARFKIKSVTSGIGYEQEQEVVLQGSGSAARAYATFTGIVESGVYDISETRVPTGYTQMRNQMLYVDDSGRMYLTNASGGSTEITKEDADGDLCLTITNKKMPGIPQTGGLGIGPVLLVGLIAMAAGTHLVASDRFGRRSEGVRR